MPHINFFVSDFVTDGPFLQVIVHEGLIIDGISIDGELFGRNHKNKKEIILRGDEKVIAIDYSLYDGTSFTDTNLDDTICRLTIKTNYDTYGPYSVPSLGCEEKVESVIVPSYLSLKDFFETYSTTTKNEGFFTFTPGDCKLLTFVFCSSIDTYYKDDVKRLFVKEQKFTLARLKLYSEIL